jgi:hypothetical protein
LYDDAPDQGAEVIKIERPDGGDTAREQAPMLQNDKGETQSASSPGGNRSKRSIAHQSSSPPKGWRSFGSWPPKATSRREPQARPDGLSSAFNLRKA